MPRVIPLLQPLLSSIVGSYLFPLYKEPGPPQLAFYNSTPCPFPPEYGVPALLQRPKLAFHVPSSPLLFYNLPSPPPPAPGLRLGHKVLPKRFRRPNVLLTTDMLQYSWIQNPGTIPLHSPLLSPWPVLQTPYPPFFGKSRFRRPPPPLPLAKGLFPSDALVCLFQGDLPNLPLEPQKESSSPPSESSRHVLKWFVALSCRNLRSLMCLLSPDASLTSTSPDRDDSTLSTKEFHAILAVRETP